MEAGEITIYMFFACAFATHPASPVRQAILGTMTLM